MNTAYLILLLPAVLTGTLLLILGYRGRRINDHPVCRKCRYDLSSFPASSQRWPLTTGHLNIHINDTFFQPAHPQNFTSHFLPFL